MRGGIFNHEIAEAKVLHECAAEVLRIALRTFGYEGSAKRFGIAGIFGFTRLQQQGQVWVHLAQHAAQMVARHRVLHAAAGETEVAHHAQQVARVALNDFHRFLVVACQHNFGTATHTQHLQVVVEGFFGELATLLQHHLVELRQG